MRCPTCGSEVFSNEKVCFSCGENNDSYIEPQVTIVENNVTYTPSSNYQYKTSSSSTPMEMSSAALVCGIIGIFVFGLIFGIIGLVLASKPNCAHPTASKVLGLINLVWGIIWLFIVF